jgi:hypothetical protein
MISVIHDTRQREERQEKNMEIYRPYAVVHYNKFVKGVHIRSEMKLVASVNSAFCFTKGVALRNSIQLLPDYLCSF